MQAAPTIIIPFALLLEATGLNEETARTMLSVLRGQRGACLLKSGPPLVRLPVVAARRLGLVRRGRRWERDLEISGPPTGLKANARTIRLGAWLSRDPRAKQPWEILSDAEEEPDRIPDLRRWLAAEAPGKKVSEPRPRAFDLEALRNRLDSSSL